MSDQRIGIGYDIHRMEPAPGGNIVIAGVTIPCDRRLVAHSDGDVVLPTTTLPMPDVTLSNSLTPSSPCRP
jgi:2-C-methyl-D-erythritol 2,4-cyclodiphosphate synthase